MWSFKNVVSKKLFSIISAEDLLLFTKGTTKKGDLPPHFQNTLIVIQEDSKMVGLVLRPHYKDFYIHES